MHPYRRLRVAMASAPGTAACAACRVLRRKCTAQCLFAPYFPPDQPQKFAHVHKVFGVANVTKMLHELPPPHREDCVNSLAYEADARVQDPVYGCVGAISVLQQQVAHLQAQLSLATSEIARLRETLAIAAAAATNHNNNNNQNNSVSSTATATANGNGSVTAVAPTGGGGGVEGGGEEEGEGGGALYMAALQQQAPSSRSSPPHCSVVANGISNTSTVIDSNPDQESSQELLHRPTNNTISDNSNGINTNTSKSNNNNGCNENEINLLPVIRPA